LEGDCSYWSLFRTVCHNSKCKEETQKFRQCPNSEREQAVMDPKTKQEVWKPVPEEEQVRDWRSDRELASLHPVR
jgi:hypothetical protein